MILNFETNIIDVVEEISQRYQNLNITIQNFILVVKKGFVDFSMVVSDQFAFVSDKVIRRNVSKIKSFMIEMKIEF